MVEVFDVLRVVAITAVAGGTSFLGGLLGRYIKFPDPHMLFLTAFGAGVLMAAAVFQMVIEAEKELGVYPMLAGFVGGSIAFSVADMIAERKGGEAGIMLGIGLDSIPESLAVGASIASGAALAVAILIGIQNVPEGIASFRELTSGKKIGICRQQEKGAGGDRGRLCNPHLPRPAWAVLFPVNEDSDSRDACSSGRRNILHAIL
ncbi:MAG: ZIP family metal transporter [Nitrososphaera sp.]|uniref:ZIP family metal transporter n=1 Tax=Nitrososphaera sp. TaxID=1971748 RepID=UPI003D6EAF83